jgi:hypothetical protein
VDIVSGAFTDLRLETKLQVILKFFLAEYLLLFDLELLIVCFDKLEMCLEA